MSVAIKIDHSGLSPDARDKDVMKLCNEARTHRFRSVCISPCWIRDAVGLLDGSKIPVSTVIGFPFGSCSTDAKIAECISARVSGATEFDVVWNLGYFKSRRPLDVMLELRTIVKIVEPCKVKVIVESSYLSLEEQKSAYNIVRDSGAQCIETSTGFATGGDIIKKLATVAMWKNMGDLEIKAAGGIRNWLDARAFLEAGADILGTSSGVAILMGQEAETGKN